MVRVPKEQDEAAEIRKQAERNAVELRKVDLALAGARQHFSDLEWQTLNRADKITHLNDLACDE